MPPGKTCLLRNIPVTKADLVTCASYVGKGILNDLRDVEWSLRVRWEGRGLSIAGGRW